MKNHPKRFLALLLISLFVSPAYVLSVNAQETNTKTTQDKPQAESKEEKELRKREESLNKKEEERKRKEAKSRADVERKYQTLNEFAEDLYASDHEFRDQVDEGYINLQSTHALQAYRINMGKEMVKADTDAETLRNRHALYPNPRVQEYVNRLGQQIVPDESDKLYAFKVVINPIPYAYTLSTGTVLVSTGMISLLDNEAQLAYVLAHELAHVYKDHWRLKVMIPLAQDEYNKKQERKRQIVTAVLAAAGAGAGGAVAGEKGALVGVISGFVVGNIIGNHYAGNLALDWNDAQEDQADEFALKATLGKFFDIQEVPKLYTRLAQAAQNDNRMQLGFLGRRSRIRSRIDYAQKMLSGPLQAQYQQALQANQIKGMTSEFNLVMADLKRDNGIEAFHHDMFQLAKMNLQQSVMLRSDDPRAAFYYGLVLKQVGRTKEELDLANQSLVKAISLDVRGEIPEVQLHRALLLMDTNNSGNHPEAVAALKNYVTDYARKRALSISNEELMPPNLSVIYGYMRLLGEKTWTAPTIADVFRPVSTTANSAASQPAPIPKVEPPAQTLSPAPVKKPRKP